MAGKASDQDASAAAAGELKYKTLVFKVLIHCEGCKKKVKKVLQAIDGVYETTVDSQQHKVTVTCSVDAETLIKKLTKSGKHVEVWPHQKKPADQKKDKKPAGKPNNNNNEKQKVDAEEASSSCDIVDEPKNKSAQKPDSAAAARNGGAGGCKGHASAGDDQPPAGGDKKGGESEEPGTTGGGNINGNGNGGKKKKKKGQKGNPAGPNDDAAAPPAGDTDQLAVFNLPDQAPPMASTNINSPTQPMYPLYAPMFYGPPLFGVSYNTTNYPSSTSEYYAPTTMHQFPLSNIPIEKYYEDGDYDDDESGCSIM